MCMLELLVFVFVHPPRKNLTRRNNVNCGLSTQWCHLEVAVQIWALNALYSV